MQVTLIHNPGAGDEEEHSPEQLRKAICKGGHTLRYQSSKEENWEEALRGSSDLVVVAGGDGTVAAVARELSGQERPISVLPLGTANNVAKTLGLTGIEFEKLIETWTKAQTRLFDLGVARGPWGTFRFIEGIGIGLIADTISRLDSEYDPTMARADGADEELDAVKRILKEDLHRFQARKLKINLDGQDLSGEYVLVEALNIKFLGPNLYLAPGADPGDGQLDLVLLPPGDKTELLESLTAHLKGELRPPGLSVVRGRRLQIEWEGSVIHIDDRIWPDDESGVKTPALIEVELIEGAIRFLVPGDVTDR